MFRNSYLKIPQTKEKEKTLFKCELCHYKSVHKTDLVRHSYAIHQTKTSSPEAVKQTDGSANKRKAVQFADSSKVLRVLEGVPEEEEEYHTECLLCKFECKNELDLNDHIKYIHTIPQNSKNVIQSWDKEEQKEKDAHKKSDEQENKEEQRENVTKAKPVTDSTDKENGELKLKLSKAEQDLELLSLKITGLTVDLESEKEEKKQALKGKLEAEKGYQEAAKVINQQTRKVFEANETIKVLQDLKKIEEESKISKQKKNDNWEECWQEDEDGNMVVEERKEVGEFRWIGKKTKIVCKKCDKIFTTETAFRLHMKEHQRMNNIVHMCDDCDHSTNDESIHINHINTVHRPQSNNKCNNCEMVFDNSSDLVAHIVRTHGFRYTQSGIKNTQYPMKYPQQEKSPKPRQVPNQVQPNQTPHNQTTQRPKLPYPSIKEFGCYDCPERFHFKQEMMQHKREKHFKKKLCSYFHGVGRGCTYPANVCINIHNENITPTVLENSDPRSRIPCKNAERCVWIQRGGCAYKHAPVVVPASVASHTGPSTSNTPTGQQENNLNVNTQNENNLIMNTLIKINHNLETMSHKLQILDLSSMTDFPVLENSLRRN